MYIIFGSWICVVAIGAVGAGDGAGTGAGAAARYPKTKDRARPSCFLGFGQRWYGGRICFWICGFLVLGRRSCCCCMYKK